jgi:Na+-translocating ferredoxin:NAD+ oxidoreductase RnfC subunit
MVKVPLKQNAGAPSVPNVKPGDFVTAGQVIAEPPVGALGAVHHASITGEVVAVGREVVIRGAR